MSYVELVGAIAGFEGGVESKECPTNVSHVLGCAGSLSQRLMDLDPNGVGVRLCMRHCSPHKDLVVSPTGTRNSFDSAD